MFFNWLHRHNIALPGGIAAFLLFFASSKSVLAAGEGEGLSIHLDPTVVGHLGALPVTNTLITVWVVMAFLIVVAIMVKRKIKLVPGKAQLILEELIGYTYNYVAEVLENKRLAEKVFPLIITIFIFILAANWIGLLPGVTSIGFYDVRHGVESFVPVLYPANTDLNVTIALAVISFIAIEFIGIFMLGFLKYGRKFINFSSPIAFLVGIIELFSEIARLISFSFRLFGNIFAGKTLILVAFFFAPYFVPVPLYAFELFVGFIQAFVFAILTLFFIKLATEEAH